jgi:hypothetical protein
MQVWRTVKFCLNTLLLLFFNYSSLTGLVCSLYACKLWRAHITDYGINTISCIAKKFCLQCRSFFLPLSDAQMKHYKEKHPANSRVNNDTEQQARLGSNVIYVPSLSAPSSMHNGPSTFLNPVCLLKYVFNCEQNYSYFLIWIIWHLD